VPVSDTSDARILYIMSYSVVILLYHGGGRPGEIEA